MTDSREQHERLQVLFQRACLMQGDDREEYLREACGGDATLRREVEELLEMDADSKEPGIALPPTHEDHGRGVPIELIEGLRAHRPTQSRYRLEGEVERGGMGAILRVWDEDLRRHLAMKVILGQGEGTRTGETPEVDSRTLGRFLEEAQVTGQLDHPGIVPVHELGVDAEGRVYFTMQLVRGRTLKQIFDRVRAGEEGWSQTRALGVLLKVCETMTYAHDKGVIHRDLKPANVMVGGYGEVYVMDWGLARVEGREDTRDLRIEPGTRSTLSEVRTDRREARESDIDSPILTMDGTVVGTPSYMSPEQALGHVERVGPRSDVYSVGAMLYQLLSGCVPFVPRGATASPRTILMRVLEGPPRPMRDVTSGPIPAELEAICEQAMARNPGERYPDMSALAGDLRAYLEGRVVNAYHTGAFAELKKWIVRNKAIAVSACTAGIIALVSLVAVSLSLAAERDALAGERRAREGESWYRDFVLLDSLERSAQALPRTTNGLQPPPRLIAWLISVTELKARLPEHLEALNGLSAKEARDDKEQYRYETLVSLVTRLERIETLMAEVQVPIEAEDRAIPGPTPLYSNQQYQSFLRDELWRAVGREEDWWSFDGDGKFESKHEGIERSGSWRVGGLTLWLSDLSVSEGRGPRKATHDLALPIKWLDGKLNIEIDGVQYRRTRRSALDLMREDWKR